MRNIAVLACLLILVCVSGPAQDRTILRADPSDRIALVVGNASYSKEPLKNTINDARAMVRALEQLGFAVHSEENANQEAFSLVVDQFIGSLDEGDVALFFYADG